MMATLLDPHKHFSAEQHAIRRLDAGPETGVADQPFAPCHPRAERVNPAPSRDDVPLLDPCCGHLSAGAEVYLGVRARPRFIDVPHVASALWVPPGFKETPLTAANPSGICADLREDKAWNSRRIPDAVLRARLSGSTDPVPSHSHAMSLNGFPFKHAGTQDSFSCDTRPRRNNSLAVLRYRYTSATQRGYEEVCWDSKLPPRLKAPDSTLEKLTDPVSELTSWRRCGGRPRRGPVSHGQQTVTNSAQAAARCFSFSAAVGFQRFKLNHKRKKEILRSSGTAVLELLGRASLTTATLL
ncbi:protein SPMIP7 [Gasterosteus aculeatus]